MMLYNHNASCITDSVCETFIGKNRMKPKQLSFNVNKIKFNVNAPNVEKELLPHYCRWTALQLEPEVKDSIRFTSIIEKNVIQITKFCIKISKNPIVSVTIEVQHRVGHVCDACVAEEWIANLPLTRSKCQVDLTNDDTMSFRVFGRKS